MQKLTALSIVLLIALLLGGCMQPVQDAGAAAAITGNVTYNERVALPDGAMVSVQLRDTDLWPDAKGLISQQQITTSGSQVPIPFNVNYDPMLIEKDHNYAMAAFIQDGNGHPIFMPGDPVPVLTNGNPIQDVQVVVVPAQGNDAAGAAPAAGEASPIASSWNAILFNDGRSAIVSVTGVQITAQFGADGQIAGFSGCNNYSATYTPGPDGTVQVGPIAATKKACSEPANVMEQESHYLAALQSAATYQVEDDSLTVQNADGEMAVQYERVGP